MRYAIATDYDANEEARNNGKNTDNLGIYSGAFASDVEGWAESVENGSGYNVYLEWRGEFFVECPTPRTESNYEQVDAILNAAINGYVAGINVAHAEAKALKAS